MGRGDAVMSLGGFLRVIAYGIYTNASRILFRYDRVTSRELRNSVLTGSVKALTSENRVGCLGCGACANICPMKCIRMVPIESPVEIIPGFVKRSVPEIDHMKCIYCFQCHDNCPITALFGLPATIHPREVANPLDIEAMTKDPTQLLKSPLKIPEDKIVEIEKLLADEASELLRRRKP